MFHSAVIRLTLWYLTIIAVLCLLFSAIVFTIANHEFQRPPGRPINQKLSEVQTEYYEDFRSRQAETARRNLLQNLLLFNIVAVSTGGLASYVLARRTLHPIAAALEAQSRFSSDAAHELRTPLSVMLLETEVGLRNTKASKTDYAAILRSNLDEIRRLQQLTDRLLALSRNEKLPMQTSSVKTIVSSAVQHVAMQAKHKKIIIQNNTNSIALQAHADSLTDAIIILLDNAIKYSAPKTTVTVTSQAKHRHIFITISDQGIGIKAADIPKLFQRFYRVDTARNTDGMVGAGLGLSLAHKIIAAHGGDIQVKSTLGQGSSFTIALPLHK